MELPFKEVGKAEASIVTLKKELEFNALGTGEPSRAQEIPGNPRRFQEIPRNPSKVFRNSRINAT